MRWWQFAGHPAVVRAGGLWAVLRHAQLAFRLLRDERVPTAVKLVIPATLLYLISPIDVMPDFLPMVGQADDLMVLLLGVLAFIKMCPAWVVAEHEASIEGRDTPADGGRRGEPVDAKYRWVDER
jgi:uncharacterized membrane protein YkvA (DUF1232 family)